MLALAHGEINVAQSMMIGSILSDILLVSDSWHSVTDPAPIKH